MASKEYKVLIKLQSEVAAAKEAIEALNKTSESSFKAQQAIDSLKGSFLSNQEVITGFNMQLGALAAGGFTKLASKAIQCIEAFGVQERASVSLAAALKSTGQDVQAALPALQDFANRMQRITNVGDEVVLQMQSIATAMGVPAPQMQKVIEGAIGLSKAFGMDLQTATKASAAAIQGKTEILTRYIPMLSECATDAEKLAKVQEAQATGFKMARAEADDTLGSIEAMKNSLGDLGEVIGEGLSPTVKIFAGGISAVSNALQACPLITKILTSTMIGLATSLALTKVGGFAGIVGGFKKITLALISTKAAAVGAAAAVKSVGVGTIAIGGISLALSTLASWYQSASEARKEFRESMQKESLDEIERIKAEMDALKVKGMDDAAQKKYVEDSAARISQIEEEIGHFKSLLSYHREWRQAAGGGAYEVKIGDPQNKALLAKIDGLKKLQNQYRENIKHVEENKALLSDSDSKTAAKNREELAKVNEELARKEEELSKKIKAEKDENFALAYAKELIAQNEARIAEIESKRTGNQNAEEAKKLGEERLALIEGNSKLLKDQERIEKSIAAAREKSAKDAEAKKRLELSLEEHKNQIEIQRLKAEGMELEAEELEISANRAKNIESFKQKFAELEKYAQNQNLLQADAVASANSIAAAETKVLDAKKAQKALEESQKKFDASVPQKELEISRAKLANDFARAEALEDALEIEKQTLALRQSGTFTEAEAQRIAAENVNIARQMQNLERERELQKVRNEAKIAELMSKGKETEAEALKLRTQATEMSNRLRINYSDALKLLRQMNAEQKKNKPEEGKRGSSTSFIRKQQQQIQDLLNSDNLGKRKQGERRQKAFEDRYGIGINDDAKEYKGRGKDGKLIDPKVGKEAEEKRKNAQDAAYNMAAKQGAAQTSQQPNSPQKPQPPNAPQNAPTTQNPAAPGAQQPQSQNDFSAVVAAIESLKETLQNKAAEDEISNQKPETDYTSILESILSAVKELRSAMSSPTRTTI